MSVGHSLPRYDTENECSANPGMRDVAATGYQ
jgi:hypothetical protein